ncbi:hypothetical protein [Arthrobacter sp. 9MFCol3.1]|uniref:hypothetical protein n=1 Tax=Arthrobacter sp. 9MFCol3.1 TaxID=1150398 RepID=UPI0018CBFB10|nr:hypothetical protein [Arthrobacter sp. 9MFCol3.1]
MAILLICLTGLNLSTVVDLTTEHVRASAAGEIPVAHLRGIKARRGPWNSELDLTFVGKARRSFADDLGTPYGVYQIALELGQDMRRHTGDEALFMVFSPKRRMETSSGFGYKRLSSNWGTKLRGFTDVHDGPGLVDTRRIRRWFLDRHQRPVAQTVNAVASIYLAKDSSTVSAYQGVVEVALEEEFQRIRDENLRRVLTTADRMEATRDPLAVAKRFDIDVAALSKLLSGELDTVTSACIDNNQSPYSPLGQPCEASFLLCLGCPCSRSEPRHLPVQASTLVELRNLRATTAEAEWQRKFSVATARLEDLMALQRADPEVEAARATDKDLRMIRALVAGDLDL